MSARDLGFDELMELWPEMEWWQKYMLLLAMRANKFMKLVVDLVKRKRVVGYIIVASWFVSAVGMAYFILQGAILPAVGFTILTTGLTMFAIYWLVWFYLR